jgi:transcriptional regulator with XRE-family HTH domain
VNGDNRVNADHAAARRRQLGRALRQARKAANLTQATVATSLKCTQGKINKMETTLVSVSQQDLERLVELYHLPADKADELRQMAELDLRDGPSRTKDSAATAAFTDLSELESEAAEILCWHSERIPGPLQSERYMLAQHEPIQRNAEVVRLLRERTARARIFDIDNPPRYRVVLSESALYRVRGGRAGHIGVDQAAHLLHLATTRECLELRILEFDADIPFVDADFVLLRFDKAHLDDFAYIEHPGGSRKFVTAAELADFRAHWDQLAAAALSRSASEGFLSGLTEMDPPLNR